MSQVVGLELIQSELKSYDRKRLLNLLKCDLKVERFVDKTITKDFSRQNCLKAIANFEV